MKEEIERAFNFQVLSNIVSDESKIVPNDESSNMIELRGFLTF